MEQENKSFEEMLHNLEDCVNNLQRGDLSLDDQIKFFTQGMEYVNKCDKQLKLAENKVKEILKNQDGNLEVQDVQVSLTDTNVNN